MTPTTTQTIVEQLQFETVESQFGTFQLFSDGEWVTQLLLPNQLIADPPSRTRHSGSRVLLEGARQLRAFLAGDLREFDLPLAETRGTDFQRLVWRQLKSIPYGVTISYAELARRIARPDVVRAVGAANGQNRLPIIVPCHRVIGSNGSLTGYAGGVRLKRALLDHEAACGL